MGGYGSGRRGPRPGAAPLVEATPRLDVGALRPSGLRLDAPGDDPPALALDVAGASYAARLDAGRVTLPDVGPIGAADALEVYQLDAADAPAGPGARVPLTWYRVGYGWRPVFVCRDCGRRARHVYAPMWTCRRCAGLAYRSTRLEDWQRLGIRARRAAAALRWPLAWRCNNGALADAPDVLPRPAGMPGRVYLRRLIVWRAARRDYGAAFALELSRGWPPPVYGMRAAARSSARRRRAAITDARDAGGRRLARW